MSNRSDVYASQNLNLGLELIESGRAEEAEKLFLKVLRSKPKNIDANINLAAIYINTKDFGKALKYLQTISRQTNSIPEVYFLYGECFRGQRKALKAAESYTIAVKLRPDYFEAQFNLGLMHRISGNHEMAISVFRKALALRPTHRETHEQLGMALIYFGNYAEGLRERIKGSGAIEFYNQGNDTFKVLS